jgi:hypothetical protein
MGLEIEVDGAKGDSEQALSQEENKVQEVIEADIPDGPLRSGHRFGDIAAVNLTQHPLEIPSAEKIFYK